jgi:hypothetical protein
VVARPIGEGVGGWDGSVADADTVAVAIAGWDTDADGAQRGNEVDDIHRGLCGGEGAIGRRRVAVVEATDGDNRVVGERFAGSACARRQAGPAEVGRSSRPVAIVDRADHGRKILVDSCRVVFAFTMAVSRVAVRQISVVHRRHTTWTEVGMCSADA